MTERKFKGSESQRIKRHLDYLARKGIASAWIPYRKVQDALAKAGI